MLGAVSPAAPEPKVEMTVQLPPFIIESSTGPRWRYMQIPRFEILSRCNDLTTEQLARAVHRANRLLGLVLPERFQVALDAPQGLIFYDQKLWPAAEQAAVAAMLRRRAVAAPGGPSSPPRIRLEPVTGARPAGAHTSPGEEKGDFFTNFMLADADTITTFALVSESTLDPEASNLTASYVGNLLQSRVPALPEWFTRGFMSLYARMAFEGGTITVKPLRWDAVVVHQPSDRSELTPDAPPLRARRALELGQQPLHLSQVNPGDQFRRNAPSGNQKESAPAPELRLPLAELVGGDMPAEDPGSWLEQAELLVSWGLDPANGRAGAFWTWLDRASVEPATEALFQECLGLDYAAATRSIVAYSTNHRGIRWTLPDHLARPPTEPLEDASPRQIARLKGEWERLEARYVRRSQPDLEEHYVELARKTLRKAYDRGDRDPRLLASLGLLELEAGNKAAAAGHLAAAVVGGVVRPRAYYELARLRYDALVGRSKRNDGKFSAEQINGIVDPLLAGMKQSPPLAPAYELLAHVSTLSIEPPSDEVTEALAQGARLFPARRDRLLELATQPVGHGLHR